MKTLKEFRRSRVRMTKTQYCETYGVPGDDIMGPSLYCYADSVFISITATGYHLLIDRSEYEGTDIEVLEATLWDDFYKEEIGLSYNQIEEELHMRSRELANELGCPHQSLDEIDQRHFIPEQRMKVMYLLNQFDLLREKKVEPKNIGKVYNINDVISAIEHITQKKALAMKTGALEDPVVWRNEVRIYLKSIGYD
jgi:hypothetical protein